MYDDENKYTVKVRQATRTFGSPAALITYLIYILCNMSYFIKEYCFSGNVQNVFMYRYMRSLFSKNELLNQSG